jgi:hypothetical protein
VTGDVTTAATERAAGRQSAASERAAGRQSAASERGPRSTAGARTWFHRHPAGRAVSLAVAVGAFRTAYRLGHGRRDPLLWTCAVAPDVALLIGIAAAPTWQRLPRYAVAPYNALHSPAVPAALLAAAAARRNPRLTVAGLAWLAHLAWDRACGYGPRDADGYVS